MTTPPHNGGCQCGAIRFRVEKLGRASMCHCRMCQKAFGGVGGALVTAERLTWTRGALKHYWSSNRIRRGFCADCGTPLTFEFVSEDRHLVDVAIATLDSPAEIKPEIQYSPEMALPWTSTLTHLPGYPAEEHERRTAWFASIRSHQHPDHETDSWPPVKTP
jgi:hypothetical protein